MLPDSSPGPLLDLAAALDREVGLQDAASLLVTGAPPEPREDRVYVLLQGDGEVEIDSPEPGRTISVVTALPGSERFERGVEPALRSGAAFHVNSIAVERLRELGVPARHLQLGFSRFADRVDPAGDPETLRRGELIVLRSGGYFDWPRALGAIHAGAVVLHEQSLGVAPLVAGKHLFVAAADALDPVAAALLRDPERLLRVRQQAREFAAAALPLALAAAALIGAARTLVAQPLAGAGSTPGQLTASSK